MRRYIKPLQDFVRLPVNHVTNLASFPPSIEIFLAQMSCELIICEHERLLRLNGIRDAAKRNKIEFEKLTRLGTYL